MLLAFKLAFRRLVRTPVFTATALLTLAICLGANLTIFAAVDAIVFRPLPFPHPERLVLIGNNYPRAGVERLGASMPNYFDRRSALKSVSSLAIYQEASIPLDTPESPRAADILRVSPGFFRTLGVPLAQGREFEDRDLPAGSDNVAVITDRFWRSYFKGAPDVLGRTFLNDGLPITVVGVLQRNFHFLSSQAEFFRPTFYNRSEVLPGNRHNNSYFMIARLAEGASVANLQSEIDAFNVLQAPSFPLRQVIDSMGFHTVVRDLHSFHIRSIKTTLLLLQCGVLFLLLTGCINLANLLLVRVSHRNKEFAVRQALGARSRNIILGVVNEIVLLAAGGVALGLLLGTLGIDFLNILGAQRLPLGARIAVDGRAVMAALIMSGFVAATLFVPIAVYILRLKMNEGLQVESRSSTTSHGTQKLRHLFLVAQIALAFVLLSGATVLGASLRKALQTSPGFEPQDVMSAQIALPSKTYPTGSARLALLDRLLSSVRATPGIDAAAFINGLPFSSATRDTSISVVGQPPREGENLHAHFLCFVSGGYWSTMQIPLKAGRFLTEADIHAGNYQCVVDQALADYYWPKGDAIGHQIIVGAARDDADKATIVGVVGNVKQKELTENKGHGTVYFTYPFFSPPVVYLVVRTTLPPSEVASAARKEVATLDPQIPLDDWKSMPQRIDETLIARRSPALLAVLFAIAALALAALGTYGVVSYAVAQREGEIGVRIALGAAPRHILRQFFVMGLRLFSVGAVIGLAGGWAAESAMQSVLVESSGLQPSAFLFSFVPLAAVTLAASFLPAWRAAQIEPSSLIKG